MKKAKIEVRFNVRQLFWLQQRYLSEVTRCVGEHETRASIIDKVKQTETSQ